MNVNIWWQDLAGRSPPSDDSDFEGRKSHKIFNHQKISGHIHFLKECNTNTSWDMKNDSDIYSGHKTLLKISIYQFNKTSSGVTEAEPPRDRYHEAVVVIHWRVGNRWWYAGLCHNWGDFEGHDEWDVCVLKSIILNLTLGIQGSDPHTYKSTGCSLQIPYQCRSRFRFSNTDKNIPFKLNISSHCVAHGLKWLFCVFFIAGGARHHFAKGAKILWNAW